MRLVVLAATLVLGAAGCSSPECCKPEEKPAAAAPAEAAASGEIREVKPSKDYPLEKCVVSGEELDEMGEPVAIVYQGVEVQFCCRNCIAEFKKDPNKYLAKLEAAKTGK